MTMDVASEQHARQVAESAERDAVTLPSPEMAAWMQAHLGQQLTAYLAGLTDAKMVGRWAAGKAQPRSTARFRMQTGYHAARLLVAAFGDTTARSWLFGSNSLLDGEAPAWVLRHGETPDAWRPVVPAALHFIAGGYSRASWRGGSDMSRTR